MSESMKLKVSSKGESYEGTVTLPGLVPTKVQKSDGTTKFSTRSACLQAAKSAAKKLGCDLVEEQQAVKKAAKKSSAKKTATKKKPTVTNPSWLNS